MEFLQAILKSGAPGVRLKPKKAEGNQKRQLDRQWDKSGARLPA